jgi:hypothetical protein
MLEHLRRRIMEALQEYNTVTLATSGPAGLEISPCESRADGLNLILLVPTTSEHLVNIETEPQVAITQDHWRLTGKATPTRNSALVTEAEVSQLMALEVHPCRFEFLTQVTHQVVETIDIYEDD